MALPPQINERLERLRLKPADVQERFVRGSGPGGQKINKTSSTVTLRHGPSGLEVRCQEERSQSANRERAWDELCTKFETRLKEQAQELIQKREAERRRTRPKSRGQKIRMIESKKRRSKNKAMRGQVSKEG